MNKEVKSKTGLKWCRNTYIDEGRRISITVFTSFIVTENGPIKKRPKMEEKIDVD